MEDDSIKQKVQEFLAQLEITAPDRSETINAIRRIFFDIYPSIGENIMYGGIVHFMDGEMISGIFNHKNHISIEFGNGYMMNDAAGHLEGKGQYRRHLKIYAKEDIALKNLEFYILQSKL